MGRMDRGAGHRARASSWRMRIVGHHPAARDRHHRHGAAGSVALLADRRLEMGRRDERTARRGTSSSGTAACCGWARRSTMPASRGSSRAGVGGMLSGVGLGGCWWPALAHLLLRALRLRQHHGAHTGHVPAVLRGADGARRAHRTDGVRLRLLRQLRRRPDQLRHHALAHVLTPPAMFPSRNGGRWDSSFRWRTWPSGPWWGSAGGSSSGYGDVQDAHFRPGKNPDSF